MILGIRRWPILPTLLVVVSAAIMVMLGLWQLDRLAQKEALLADYARAQTMSADAPWPGNNAEAITAVLYRHARLDCLSTTGEWQSIAGRNADDRTGYVHLIECAIGDGRSAWVQAGWSPGPTPPAWTGGEVGGYIAHYPAGGGAKLVADTPLGGLEANAVPDPSELPNNHLAYAGQWFFFALIALVIYVLALRRKQSDAAR